MKTSPEIKGSVYTKDHWTPQRTEIKQSNNRKKDNALNLMQIVTNLVLNPYKGIPFKIPIFPLLTYIFAKKMAPVFTCTVCSSALLDFGHSNTINMKGWQFYKFYTSSFLFE